MIGIESKGRWSQLGGLLGAGFATACCLGLPAALSLMTALGAGFLIRDEYLFPLFVLFIGLSLWGLRVSTRHHGYAPPFWLGLAGAAFAAGGLFLLVTGRLPRTWPVYVGLAGVVGGSLWDLVRSRMKPAGAPAAPPPSAGPNTATRIGRGAAIAAAVGVVFAAGYEAVRSSAPEGSGGNVRCFGINSCKGTTACSTRWNACNGQNECKGKGWISVGSVEECRERGGELLSASEAAPRT